MRVLVRAPFNRYSGYGNDGVDIVRWLDRVGVDVYPWPINFMPGVPEDFAKLLTKKPRRGSDAYDVTLTFAPPFDIRVSERSSKMIRQPGLPKNIARVHVGWSMWEQTKLTRDHMRGHGVGRSPWKHLTWMYATSQVSISAFMHYEPRVEYRLLPCGIDGDLYPFAKRGVSGPTRFCMVGELHVRKDPYLAIEAFHQLKREKGADFDAELHLKTTVRGLPKQLESVVDGLYVHDDWWTYERLIRWMQDMHCYVGPSRGEGNLKPPMEFMATGGTVIVTNWSGPENWLHRDVGYPLNYRLGPVHPGEEDGPMEAKADLDHLKQLMWHVHTNRVEASRKGMLAAEWIRKVASWERIVRRAVRDFQEALDS